jgi:hypothetical protein
MTTISSPDQTKRAEYVKGLRALADILEQHPELRLPYEGDSPDIGKRITFHFLSSDDPRSEIAAARRALGVPLEKEGDSDSYFYFNGNLHGLYFNLVAFRNEVCERVVVGTREVEIEEPDPELLAQVPTVKRTETVEDVEWQCHPILAEAEAVAR